jgi:hypothetical protein
MLTAIQAAEGAYARNPTAYRANPIFAVDFGSRVIGDGFLRVGVTPASGTWASVVIDTSTGRARTAPGH